ncbi:MAG: hypothetical protein JJU00_04950 [Opitutales bacterium]|nr:hypothetical protein [Opitutales bacterium]
MLFEDIGTLDPGAPLETVGEYGVGEARFLRFTIPEGLASLRVSVDEASAYTMLRARYGATPPMFAQQVYDFTGTVPTDFAMWSPYDAEFEGRQGFSIQNPEAGEMTLAIGHSAPGVNSPTAPEGSPFRIVAEAQSPEDLDAGSGTHVIASLDSDEWRLFRIEIPATRNGHPVLGWELQILGHNVDSSSPRSTWLPWIVVRRDAPPGSPGEVPAVADPEYFASGDQLHASQSYYGMRLAMGKPLVPGTYYVGIHNRPSHPLFTDVIWSTQLIGYPDSEVSRKVHSLDFGGGVATGSLADGELAYFAVDIPAGTPSWHGRLELPEGPRASLRLRHGSLPTLPGNLAVDLPGGFPGQLHFDKRDGGQRFVLFPESGQEALPPGRYYIEVGRQWFWQEIFGNDETNNGSLDFTLHSEGPATVTLLGNLGDDPTLRTIGSYPEGGHNHYQFEVPPGLASVRVRLTDRTGNPSAAVRTDNAIPRVTTSSYGIWSGSGGLTSSSGDIRITDPDPGIYSITIGDRAQQHNIQPGGYTLSVFGSPWNTLPIDKNGDGLHMSLEEGLTGYATMVVPDSVDGEPLLGWMVRVEPGSGSATFTLKDSARHSGSFFSYPKNSIVVGPPHLESGSEWHLRVTAVESGDFRVVADAITESSLRREPWAMPDALEGDPVFGDTADAPGADPIDGGMDLPLGAEHFYAVDVPEANGGLLAARLDVFEGSARLYGRHEAIPSYDFTRQHFAPPATEDMVLSRSDSTQRAYWVPHDQRRDDTLPEFWNPLDREPAELAPGRWYFRVRSGDDSPARYRLRFSHLAEPLLTSWGATGGSIADASIERGEWQYFSFAVPDDPSLIPAEWHLSVSMSEDITVHIRDTVPPGDSGNNPIERTLPNSWIRDWSRDGLDPGGHGFFQSPGQHTIKGIHLRPGRTYFVGVRARLDGTFSLSMTPSAETLGDRYGVIEELSAEGGSASVSLPPNDQRVWRVRMPEDAHRWRHESRHDAAVLFSVREDFPAIEAHDPHDWASGGEADSGWTTYFEELREREYYIVAKNTGEQPHDLELSVDWRYRLVVDYDAARGSVAKSPDRTAFHPEEFLVLEAVPEPGFEFIRWEGDKWSRSNPLAFTIDDDTYVDAVFWPAFDSASLSPSGLHFQRGGAAKWDVQTEVVRTGRSTATAVDTAGAGTASWLETDIHGKGMLVFWRKTQLPDNAVLVVFVNDVGMRVFSGKSEWQPESILLEEDANLITWLLFADDGDAGAAYIDEVVFTPAAETHSTYESWYARSMLPVGLRAPEDIAETGLPGNLLAYAMGINPVHAGSAWSPSVDVPEPGVIRLTYSRNTAATDASLTIWQSADLNDWNPVSPVAEHTSPSGPNTEKVQADFQKTGTETNFFRVEAKFDED